MEINNLSSIDLISLPQKLKESYAQERYSKKYCPKMLSCDEFVVSNLISKEKKSIISNVLSNLKVTPGINSSAICAFKDELMTVINLQTLKKALYTGVLFKLGLGSKGAVFAVDCDENDVPKEKAIVFSIDGEDYSSVYSLGHELGHVFDFETTIEENGLTQNLEYDLVKDENGNYQKADYFMPNTVSYMTIPNGKIQISIEIDDIEQNASFSKEFEDAFLKDYINMLDMDKMQGIKEGTTFNNLLSDWGEDSYFAYFLGADRNCPEISKPYKLKKELFAQLAGYSAFGHTSKPEFDKKVLLYFPNTYKFVDELIKKTL